MAAFGSIESILIALVVIFAIISPTWYAWPFLGTLPKIVGYIVNVLLNIVIGVLVVKLIFALLALVGFNIASLGLLTVLA